MVPLLAQRFQVLSYDRRGHSLSEAPPGPGSIDEDAADLAALIDELGLAPAHVAGLSSGGAITLRLTARRPDLFRSLSVQEPPLFKLLADDAGQGAVMHQVLDHIEAVADLLAAGDAESGARWIMETVAFGPGAWAMLPPDVRQLVVSNASTFLDEARDPASSTLDVTALASVRPVLLTHGDQSPPWFAPVVALLANLLPRASTAVFPGAGHLPMVTHPTEYAATLATFAASADHQV